MSAPCSADYCERKHYAKGWCLMHYTRWKRHGDPYVKANAPAQTVDDPSQQVTIGNWSFRLDLFWAKVNKSGGCWEWTASRSHNGYGEFRVRRNGESALTRSHRVAYTLAHGPIPDGMQIDHTCHNRACVNPAHLRLATARQNHENLSGPIGNNTSGVRGVFRAARGRPWRAAVGHDGGQIHLGKFDTRDEAEAAAIAKRNEIYTHNDLDRRVK